MILDIHSHRSAPYPEGVVSLDFLDAPLLEGQLYSAGIHPWDTKEMPSEELFSNLEVLAADPRVVAIGECGVDLQKGGPMFRQLQVLKRQIDLSERLEKPLVLHCVKGADIIMGLKRDLQPRQQWVVHGFRGKPELAAQLVAKGIMLSFGEKFNPATVKTMPGDMLLAETDESELPIEEVISHLSEAAGMDLMPVVAANAARVLGITLETQ